MKVVIDITEEDYLNLIKTDENGEKEIPLGLLMSLWDCVKYKCTPLPKCHGDLVTKEQMIELVEFYQINPQHFDFVYLIDDIKDEKPVIEADK